MLDRMRITDRYRHAGAFSALVNIQSAIDPQTFLTRGGDLIRLLRVGGVDPECLDAAETGAITRQCENAIRQLGEGIRVYQYLIKRPFGPLPHSGDSHHPVVDSATLSRIKYLSEPPDRLQRFELYTALVYPGPRVQRSYWHTVARLLTEPRAVWKAAFSTSEAASALVQSIERGREILSERTAGFVAQLRDVLQVEPLDKQEGFAFLRQLLNFAPYQTESVQMKHDDFVGQQLCGSVLECYPDRLKLDNYTVRVFSLKEPPGQTFPALLQGLHTIPSSLILATEWQAASGASLRQLIQSKRRHFHNAKHSLASYLNSGTQRPMDTLVDEGASAIVHDLGDCLSDLELKGQIFGTFSLTAVLYDEDPARLKRSVAECAKVFATHDAQVFEERYNLLNSFLSIVPGNDAFNLRRLWISLTNYADLAPLFTVNRGSAYNPHLAREYLAILATREGTPYFFNLHYQDVAHTLIVGATGSGKSFLLNFLVANLQKYTPFTFILDLGGSYKQLTRLFGGSYLHMGREDSRCPINPFSLDPTPANQQFLFAFVRVLIEISGYRMTTADERDLFEQIANVYLLAVDQRRLLTLANMLSRHLRLELHKWVQGGQYGDWFDNAEDHLTLARFQAFDFEGMEKQPHVLEPLLFYLLHRAQAVVGDAGLEMVFKAFVLDEAWRFLRHPTIRQYVEEGLKTWRKKNAAVILATQSSVDLSASEVLTTVAESCATQIFLANPGMDRTVYQKLFHLNDTQAEHIAKLMPKREMLIKQAGAAKIVELVVDRSSHSLYANCLPENEKRRDSLVPQWPECATKITAKET